MGNIYDNPNEYTNQNNYNEGNNNLGNQGYNPNNQSYYTNNQSYNTNNQSYNNQYSNIPYNNNVNNVYNNKLAKSAFILGVVGMLTSIPIPLLGIILGIIGILKSNKYKRLTNMSCNGFVLSIVSIVLSCIVIPIWLVVGSAVAIISFSSNIAEGIQDAYNTLENAEIDSSSTTIQEDIDNSLDDLVTIVDKDINS